MYPTGDNIFCFWIKELTRHYVASCTNGATTWREQDGGAHVEGVEKRGRSSTPFARQNHASARIAHAHRYAFTHTHPRTHAKHKHHNSVEASVWGRAREHWLTHETSTFQPMGWRRLSPRGFGGLVGSWLEIFSTIATSATAHIRLLLPPPPPPAHRLKANCWSEGQMHTFRMGWWHATNQYATTTYEFTRELSKDTTPDLEWETH